MFCSLTTPGFCSQALTYHLFFLPLWSGCGSLTLSPSPTTSSSSGSEAAESQGGPALYSAYPPAPHHSSLLAQWQRGASSCQWPIFPPKFQTPPLPVLTGSKLLLSSYFMPGPVLGTVAVITNHWLPPSGMHAGSLWPLPLVIAIKNFSHSILYPFPQALFSCSPPPFSAAFLENCL